MFRWKRGLLHGLLAFGVVLGVGVALVLLLDPADPEKFGEGTGRFAAFSFVIGIGVSYLRQTGRRRAAWIAGVAFVGLVVALTALVVSSAPGKSARATAADRAPLVERQLGEVVRLVHPTFGFSILRPPASYHDAPQMAGVIERADPSAISYVYAEDPAATIVVVSIAFSSDLAASVRGMRRGIEESLAKQAGSGLKLDWVRDDTHGDEANLHGIAGALHIQIASHVLRDRQAIVHTMVMAADATTLGDVLTSFQREAPTVP